MYFNVSAKNVKNYFFDLQIFIGRWKRPVVFILCLAWFLKSSASENVSTILILSDDSSFAIVKCDSAFANSIDSAASSPKHTRLAAAILSFPFPFGIFGGHRLYFGTKPFMPFVYIATLGGCFGILPLIDFIAILTSGKENFDRFTNNPKVFMWSK